MKGSKVKGAKMKRINSGVALLVGHNTSKQVGVIEKAEIGTGRKGHYVIRFEKGEHADAVFKAWCL